MMSDTPPPTQPPEDVGGLFSRVHHLGRTAEEVFSRLYAGFTRRNQPAQTAMLNEQALQAENERLRQHLRAREEQIEQLQGVIATIGDGIIIQDENGRITLWNEAAHNLIGPAEDYLKSPIGPLYEAYASATGDGELVPLGRTERLDLNGKVVGVQMAAIGDGQGQRIGTVTILRDLSPMMPGDDARLTAQLITSISHELKTPLSVLRIASEILLGQPEDMPANQRLLEKISKNVDVLDRMVIEMLDVAEMTSGLFTVRHEALNAEDLVNDVILSFQPEIVQARLEVTLMARDLDQLQVEGDVARLKWGLGHILRNAIAYTEADGRITVFVYRDNRDRNRPLIAIRIEDSGVGIADEDMPHIFDLFYRGHARDRTGKRLDPRGLGQGLYIAQKVAEAHNGYIYVDSEQHKGSAFTFIVPASPARLSAS